MNGRLVFCLMLRAERLPRPIWNEAKGLIRICNAIDWNNLFATPVSRRLDELTLVSEDVRKVKCIGFFLGQLSRMDLTVILKGHPFLFFHRPCFLNISFGTAFSRVLSDSHCIMTTGNKIIFPVISRMPNIFLITRYHILFACAIDHEQPVWQMLFVLIIKRAA